MDWEIPLWDQFIGVFILSFVIFLIILGIIYTYFATRSSRIHGYIIISIGTALAVLLFGIGKIFLDQDKNVPWWNIFKLEAIFADLGAFLGIMVVLGIIMIVIIQTDKKG
jgi:hypothetical protein